MAEAAPSHKARRAAFQRTGNVLNQGGRPGPATGF